MQFNNIKSLSITKFVNSNQIDWYSVEILMMLFNSLNLIA